MFWRGSKTKNIQIPAHRKKEKKWQFDDRAIMKGLFVSTASVCGYVFNTYQISKDG